MAAINNLLLSPNSYFAVANGGEAAFKNGISELNLGVFTYNGLNYNVFVESIVNSSNRKEILVRDGRANVTRIFQISTKTLVDPNTTAFNEIAALALPVIIQNNPQVSTANSSQFSSALYSGLVDYSYTAGNQQFRNTSPTLESFGGFTGIGNNLTGAGAFAGPSILQYPLVFPPGMDRLKLTVYEYVPRGARGGGGGLTAAAVSGSPKKVIYLPIPLNFQDQNSVSWQNGQLGPFGKAALQAATAAGRLDFDALKDAIGKGANVLLQGKVLQAYGASAALSVLGGSVTPEQVLAYSSGELLNPNLELMFQGLNLRNFTFTYEFYAQSAEEGLSIRSLIGYLKYAMAAKATSGANDFIKVPYIFLPEFLKDGAPHPGLNKFKICALKDLSVNYNGKAYSTFIDGTMQCYSVTMSFGEMEVLYDADYPEQGAGGTIGF